MHKKAVAFGEALQDEFTYFTIAKKQWQKRSLKEDDDIISGGTDKP
jgi:hypothetical protein